MPWISFESTSSIVLNIVGGFLAGIALILIQTGWKFIDKRLNRRVAVRNFREFFRDWETSTEENAVDPAFQFVAHEMKIRRMKENIVVSRPHLSGEQASDVTELISGHEEVIEARKRLVLDHREPPVPEHRSLSPEDYRRFFDQAKAIKWLKL